MPAGTQQAHQLRGMPTIARILNLDLHYALQALEAVYHAAYVDGSPLPLAELVTRLLAVPPPRRDGVPLSFRLGPARFRISLPVNAVALCSASSSGGSAHRPQYLPKDEVGEANRTDHSSKTGSEGPVAAQRPAAEDSGGREQDDGMELECPDSELSLALLGEALSVDNLIALWLSLLLERRWHLS